MDQVHMLLVDDDPALLHALSEALHLRVEGLRLDITESARAALDLLASTDYDVVITDIKMPGMDGLALLKRLKDLRPQTPVLLITGHGEHDLAVQALRGGAYDYLEKPLDRDDLVASLQRALEVRQLSRQVEAQRLALEHHAAVLERAVQERTRDLLEANRVKERFLHLAAHELKTPLTSIKLWVQLARRQGERQQFPLAHQLGRVVRSIVRMEQLINNLLSVSRLDAGTLIMRLEQCPLHDLCQQVADEQAAMTNRVITFTPPERPIYVMGASERLGQVLTNLLANALENSPDTTAVALTVTQDGERAILGVRDQGAGIPADALPHLFERFSGIPGTQGQSSSGRGLGLGLYLCREIVERHCGHIWAESAAGQGSTFFVSLPLVDPSPQERAALPEQPSGEPLAL